MPEVKSKPITSEMWKDIEEQLRGHFAHVKFKLRDVVVTVERRHVSESKSKLTVFLNGVLEFKRYGLAQDTPIDMKDIVLATGRISYSPLYTPSHKKRLQKAFTKKELKEHFPRLDEKMEWVKPFFPSARSLCSQYKKIEGLELVVKEDEA